MPMRKVHREASDRRADEVSPIPSSDRSGVAGRVSYQHGPFRNRQSCHPPRTAHQRRRPVRTGRPAAHPSGCPAKHLPTAWHQEGLRSVRRRVARPSVLVCRADHAATSPHISLDCRSNISCNDTQVKLPRRQGYRMRARAQDMAETRERIVHAMAKLGLEQAYEDITLTAIAREAGVSHQTVLNHFDSKEGVAAAAAEVLSRETIAARNKAVPGDVAGAIRVLVGEYERIGDAGVRWALAADRLGSLAPLLDGAREGHQIWLQRTFGDQLPGAGGARTRAIHGLHAATDVYVWKLLRRDLRLTREETEAIMAKLVRGILAERPAPHSRRRILKGLR